MAMSAGREPQPIAAQRSLDEVEAPDAVRSAEQDLPKTFGPLPLPLPPATALLRVHRRTHEGVERFYLELQSDADLHRTASPQDLGVQGPPDLALAEVMARGSLRPAIAALRSWSTTKLALRQWITALRRRHGRELRLIVWDETNFQIPWELFFHDTGDPADRGWLGADFEVIRWTAVFTEIRPDWLTSVSSACNGQLLAFTDPTFPNPAALLARYPHESFGSLDDLLHSLDDTARNVGVVFIWGHGIASSNGERSTLAGVSLDRLEVFKMRAMLNSRTLVLLNACGSGQLLNDDRFGEQGTRNFAEMFLRRGARGVIATSGQVDKADSYDFAWRLLSESESEDLSVPGMLLAHRTNLADALPSDPSVKATDEQLREFFNGFMYLYFGNPNTLLRMLPSGADT
ncbi:CHAT domain-containing protein [Catellatospora sp. NPDC049111]|uniref:CHAT domain-containing protein n=1 Tax=Catellatospora sp. NPDC049111 TaxID=3155271 RepID=UPI0033CB449B